MNYRINILTLLLLLGISCKETPKKVVVQEQANGTSYASTEHLIEAEELLRIIEHKSIKIVDFRKEEDYSQGHIEKALNVWRSDLEDTSYNYKGMIPQKEMVETLFSGLGISNQDTIVVYDNKGSADAARLWWILKIYGFEPVRILNGGLLAWEANDGPLSTKTEASGATTDFKLPSDIDRKVLATKEDVIAAISKKGHKTHLIDVRTAEEYSGEIVKEGATKAGRIPQSIHIDWAETIENDGTKKFKTYSELENIYNKAGVGKKDSIIVYCHTGGRAAHTSFVLSELLGYENVKNYDGSWTEWSRFDELPFEKDSITIINK